MFVQIVKIFTDVLILYHSKVCKMYFEVLLIGYKQFSWLKSEKKERFQKINKERKK